MNTKTELTEQERLIEDSHTFAFLHDLFRYPTHEQWAWLNHPETEEALIALFQSHEISCPLESHRPSGFDDYQQSFISLFEVGVPHPPCPLIESHWNKQEPTSTVLHENLLFYRTFGLKLKVEAEETSDHLRFQLEFYRRLLALSVDAASDANKVEQYEQLKLARNDFLQRRLAAWTPLAAAAAQTAAPDSCYLYWLRILDRCVARQLELLSGEGCT